MPDQYNQRNIWRKLKRNKAAIFGVIIIALSFLTALFAHLIAPDPSPDANRMILEIGGEKPGYTQQFLLLPKQKQHRSTSLFQQFASGTEDRFLYIPITAFHEQNNTLVVQKYIDEGLTEKISYPFSDTKTENKNYIVKTHRFYLGTDKYGRDILSRLLVGVRVSLSVGLITVVISLTIGIVLGALAGYFRGTTDNVIMWFINIIWSIPTLLLVFAITLLLGKGYWQVFIAIGLTMWVNVARIIRGQVLIVREMEYVEAARALGFSDTRIIFRHILPNVMGPVLVVAASNFASAIVIEAGLSFLGVGVQPPQPSWGLMIKENYNFIITHNPMLALAPGFAIMLLVLAFNMLGSGLRDALQVKE
ncbi:MAG: ABC transporter permease [Chitinophagaceae bacterium]|nr:ABC transporter permease [Chitinophagaceae bacterium]